MFRVGDSVPPAARSVVQSTTDFVVQSTTQPHRFRVGDFIIINPELISEFRTGKFPSDSGIILKNGEFYDGDLKYGCVILSIANDEVNQYYNSERYCLDANLAMVILGEECRHTVAIRPTDRFGIGFVDLKDFVVPSQEQLQEFSNYKLCKLYQSGIINDLTRLRYDCGRWQNYNVPIFEKAQDMFSASVCFLEDSDEKCNRADELKNYLELFLKTDKEYREYDYSIYYGDRIRDDEIKDFDDEFVARGYLSYKFESQDDDVELLPF